MTHVAISKNGVQIRLTEERWQHIIVGHPEMTNHLFDVLETVENPETIYFGNGGALLAVKNLKIDPDKFIVVAYKELPDQSGILIDGFIITAYSSKNANSFQKRPIAWQP
ncbi:MAG: hypothetical protein ACKVUS_03275 [Saprospiraceae bacterium]